MPRKKKGQTNEERGRISYTVNLPRDLLTRARIVSAVTGDPLSHIITRGLVAELPKVKVSPADLTVIHAWEDANELERWDYAPA